MSEQDRRVDDPRITELLARVTTIEAQLGQMAPRLVVSEHVAQLKLEMNGLASEIKTVTHAMNGVESQISRLTESMDKQYARLAGINEENMIKAAKQVEERHAAEVTALKQQIEDSKPENRLKVVSAYVQLFLAGATALGILAGAFLWWLKNQ